MNNRNDGNIFDYINEQVNLVDVISNYVTLERSGKNHKALCPFHNEKTASFIVSEEKQLYHCFGCGAAGNSVSFIMNYENLDAIDAVEFLADRYHIDISAFQKNSIGKNASNLNHYYDILRDAAIFYYKNLRTQTEPMQYLEKRGIHYDVIKQFGLGFSSDAWSDLLKQLSGKYPTESLEKVGLIIKNKEQSRYYDRFRNRIMFPIINPKGKVVGFGGRVMDDSLPKYLNSPETDVFNKSHILYGLNLAKNHKGTKKQLIITEGYMDVIALHTKGVTNAVATLGTALTTDHARLMRRYADEVLLCFDSDVAGQNAALKSIDVLSPIVNRVRVITLGEGLDPDDYIRKYGLEAFEEKCEQAVSGVEFKINHLKQGYNLNDEQSVVEFLSKAAHILSEIDNTFEKNLQVEKLGKLLNVNTEMIAKAVFKDSYKPKENYGFHKKTSQSISVPKVTSDKKIFLEEQLLTYLIHHYDGLSETQLTMIQQFKHSDKMEEIFKAVLSFLNSNSKFSQQAFIEESDLSVSTAVIEILSKHSSELDDNDIDLIIQNIMLLTLDEEINALTQTLKNAADVQTTQREIHQKILLKQELTMNMRQRKLKN